jgi:uncharacterized protein YcbK (DUF882 family)
MDTIEMRLNLYKLVGLLEWIRGKTGNPIHINCAYRCDKHNKEVGGVYNSTHTKNMGADITVKGLKPNDVYNLIDADPMARAGGLKEYPTFVHVDVWKFRRW